MFTKWMYVFLRVGVRRDRQIASFDQLDGGLPHDARRVREGRRDQLPHRLHRRSIKPARAKLQDRRGGQPPDQAGVYFV